MKLEMPDLIGENGLIKPEYTCDGDGASPEIIWSRAPPETKSFALYCHDPDAPAGNWIHWIIINIPADENRIPKHGPVPGVEVINDFGRTSYGGPCPPSGVHRYYFIVYALSVEELEGVTKQNFLDKIRGIILAKTEVIGRYKRS